MVEFCLDDMAVFQRWLSWYMSEDAKPMRTDEQNFMDGGSVEVMALEERGVAPRDPKAA